MTKDHKSENQPKQYLQNVPRKWVYGCLIVLAVVAGLLYLCVPHYKPLKYANAQAETDAHREIIQQYFVVNTTCKDDNREKTDRVKTFNKYFKTNQFANRAVFRGCNDVDYILYRDDAGKWQKFDHVVELDGGMPLSVNEACLTEDIIKRNEAGFSDKVASAAKLERLTEFCDSLAKESYVEVNLKTGIHLHF